MKLFIAFFLAMACIPSQTMVNGRGQVSGIPAQILAQDGLQSTGSPAAPTVFKIDPGSVLNLGLAVAPSAPGFCPSAGSAAVTSTAVYFCWVDPATDPVTGLHFLRWVKVQAQLSW